MQRTLLAIMLLIFSASAVGAQNPKKQVPTSRVAIINLTYIMYHWQSPRFKAMQVEHGQGKNDTKRSKRQEDHLVFISKDIQQAVQTVAKQDGIDVVFGYGDILKKELVDQFPNVNRKMQAMDLGGTLPLFVSARIDITQAVARRLNQAKPAEGDDKPAKTDSVGTDRVAVVNIAHVFQRYKKAIQIKALLVKSLEPYKNEAKELANEIRSCEAKIRSKDFDIETQDMLEAKIRKAKTRLEDMNGELARELGKKQEDSIVELWKDMQAGIKTYAERNQIDLVLGYGDPTEEVLLDLFPSVNRKMQALDNGFTVPLHAPARLDIAEGVTRLLNNPDEAMAKFNVNATRVGVAEIGYVFNKYDRAVKFKKDLDAELAPYKQKETQLNNLGAKRELEDLRHEMNRISGSKTERNQVTVWKDIKAGIKSHAIKADIELVLGYSDPLEPEALDRYSNVRRKCDAMDNGSMVPLFVSPRVNVSAPVTELMNRKPREAEKKAPPQELLLPTLPIPPK